MNGWTMAAMALVALTSWWAYRRRQEVACTLDLESTPQEFHAHVELDGVLVNEGDEVLVHGAPTKIALGERRRLDARATVQHASLPRRFLTRVLGTSGITELYEVGFEG